MQQRVQRDLLEGLLEGPVWGLARDGPGGHQVVGQLGQVLGLHRAGPVGCGTWCGDHCWQPWRWELPSPEILAASTLGRFLERSFPSLPVLPCLSLPPRLSPGANPCAVE